MKSRTLTVLALAAGLFAAGQAFAQQQPAPAAPPAPPDLNAIPDKMPFNIPFGTAISMDRAQALVKAAVDEATKRGWAMNVAVVDPNGDLIAFGRMDGAQLASMSISQHKARVAARYRRPSAGVRGRRPKVRLQLHLRRSTTSSPRAAAFRWSRVARSSAPSAAPAAPARRTRPPAPRRRIRSTSSSRREADRKARAAAGPPSLHLQDGSALHFRLRMTSCWI